MVLDEQLELYLRALSMKKIPYAGKETPIPSERDINGNRIRKYDKPQSDSLVLRICLQCRAEVKLHANQRLCKRCRNFVTRLG